MILTKKRGLTLLFVFICAVSLLAAGICLPALRKADADDNTGNTVIKTKNDLDWTTSIFGESIDTANNGLVSGDHTDSLTIKSVNGKGKFTTSGYDGITFYNTKVDADKYDFYLEATVTVEEIGAYDSKADNWVIGGQEGFALHVRDSLGVHGDAKAGMYSNSFSAISTKITYKSAQGGNVDIYGGLGARFVEGVEGSDIPPTAIANGGKFATTYKEFDRDITASAKEEYRFSIQKINNTYTATFYKNELATVSHTMYATRDDGKDKLRVIDKDNIYVGFAVARYCTATFSNITMNLFDRSTEDVEIPDEEIRSKQEIYSTTASPTQEYELKYLSNQKGSLAIKINDAELANYKNIPIEANIDYKVTLTLPAKINRIEAVLTPDAEWRPGQYQVMSNYGTIVTRREVEVDKYGLAGETIIVTPNGSDNGDGTEAKPLSIKRAVRFAQPGQIILLRAGTYEITGGLVIESGNDGTSTQKKRIIADPNAATRPKLDFKNGEGFVLQGNWWHLKGFDVTNTGEKVKGITVWGHNNTLELLETYLNGNTGVQISSSSDYTTDKWPTNNLILNCTSYWNRDANFADADGFAAKLTCGEGNVFDGCIAYENADDGFDLYAKPDTGPIGVVIIKNSLAYRNGKLSVPGYEDMEGNGNGFKLGGAGMPGKHELHNSIAFDNCSKGVDSNSGPDVQVYNTTSYNNVSYNYALYSTAANTDFFITGAISFRTKFTDVGEQIKLQGTQAMLPNGSPYLTAVDHYIKSIRNYFWESGKSVNINGKELSSDIFVTLEEQEITRDADGSINMHGFLELTNSAPSNAGARLEKTPGEEFTIGKTVDSKTDSGNNNNKGCNKSGAGFFTGGGGSGFLFGSLIIAFFAIIKTMYNKNKYAKAS